MSVWAVIPLRGFAMGKTRLAGVLGEPERIALNRDFFFRTARCVTEALGADRVVVVSPDGAVVDAAHALGLTALREAEGLGLNGALELGKRACADRGATAILSVSCDLPRLTPDDINAALDSRRGPDVMALATDEAGSGTNALVVPADADFAFQMGRDSAARHRQSAAAAGLEIVEIRRPGFSFDVDTPDDLVRWREGEPFSPREKDHKPITAWRSGDR